MKKSFLSILFILLSIYLGAQYIPEPEKEKENKKEQRDKKEKDQENEYDFNSDTGGGHSDFNQWAKDNLFILGDVDLFLNTFEFYFSVGPKAGFMFGNNLMVGPGFRYMFIKNFAFNENLNVYGGGAFASLLFADQSFLVHLEYEALSLQYVQQNLTPPAVIRGNANLLLTGLGYRNNFGRFFYQGMLLYDLLRDPNAPYFTLLPTLNSGTNVRNTLFFRVGFGFKF